MTETLGGLILLEIETARRHAGTQTMDIADLLNPKGVIPALRVTSKKQALQELARRAAEVVGLPDRTIFEVLVERERLGTTGVGNGIAIPHGKLPGLKRLHALFRSEERRVGNDG